jgi:CubicO group peptidase (beta-lactamase class C family)
VKDFPILGELYTQGFEDVVCEHHQHETSLTCERNKVTDQHQTAPGTEQSFCKAGPIFAALAEMTRRSPRRIGFAVIACAATLLCFLGGGLAADGFSPNAAVFPDASWEATTPAEAGMDESLLEQARAYALEGGGSGMIVRGGKLVYSWGDPDTLYDLKSSTKSIGVTALGLALQDGLVRLNDAAQAHLPEIGAPPDSNIDTGWLDDITIRHLATHTAGFDKTGGYIKLLFKPGSTWAYSDGGANWLADLLTVRFGSDLQNVMSARVFEPLGITAADLTWRRHNYRDDTIKGIGRREFGSGIRANVDAMARLGYLYLRQGLWNGERILPQAFAVQAGQPDSGLAGLPVHKSGDHPGASGHYGLMWWNNGDGTLENVPTDAFWSWGLLDSLIIVIPSLDLVAVRAGNGWRPGWDSDYSVVEPFLDPIARSVVAGGGPALEPGQSPVVTIDSPANGASAVEGSAMEFAGRAEDAEDGNLTEGLEWRSDRDGFIGMGGAFTISTLSVGTHAVAASVVDSEGLSGSAAVSIVIAASDAEVTPGADEGEGAGGGGAVSLLTVLVLMGNRYRRFAGTRHRDRHRDSDLNSV